MAKGFTIQVNGRDGHDLAGFNFVAEHRAINCHMADAWIERGHDVDGLNDVGAILARQRKESFEVEVAFKRLHRIEQVGFFLGRVSAHVQQRENQRCEFMPQWQACKMRLGSAIGAADGEGRCAIRMTIKTRGQQVRLFGDGFDKRTHFRRLGAVIECRDELNRGAQVCQIGF